MTNFNDDTHMADWSTDKLVKSAIDHLKGRRRSKAARCLSALLSGKHELGTKWKQIYKIADAIGETRLAIAASGRYLKHTTPPQPEAIYFHAGVLTKYRKHQDALFILEHLPPAEKETISALHLLGVIFSEMGEMDSARDYLTRAIETSPQSGPTWITLAALVNFKKEHALFRKMHQLIPAFEKSRPENAAPFFYALAKAHEDMDDIQGAIGMIEKGANSVRANYLYNAEAEQQILEQIKSNFRAHSKIINPPAEKQYPTPIFILGLPRSGTTLLENILAARSNVVAGGELNLLQHAIAPLQGSDSVALENHYQASKSPSYDPTGALALTYRDLVSQRVDLVEYFTDKSLNLSRMASLIPSLFPDAKSIWIRRDPRDNALSCYKNYLDSSMPWSLDLTTIAQHFQNEYSLRSFYLDNSENMHVLDYEQLVQKPEETISELCQDLGWELDPAMLKPEHSSSLVQTASVAQVRAPIADRSVGSWKRYDDLFADFPALDA